MITRWDYEWDHIAKILLQNSSGQLIDQLCH